MKVYTGDEIGTIKVVDTGNQTVQKVLKSSKPSRDLKVTHMEMLDGGKMLVCRKGGLVELIEVARPSPPIWAVGVPGCPVFATFLLPDRLTVFTSSGYMMLIDVTKIQPYESAAALATVSTEGNINWYADEDPVLAYVHEMTDNIDWKKYVENLKETFDYEYVNHAYNDDSNDSSDGKDDDGNDSDSNDSDSNSGKGDDDNDDDDDDVSLKEVGYSDGEEQDHVRESQPRPEWLIQLRRITSDSLTCGFAFSDAEGRLCVAAAGKLLPLRVYYYDGARLELRFYTLHTGRMVKRARPPKIMCSGHLDHMGGMDALYAVDQKGKVRVYLMVELARQAEETERSRGPIVTFQGTNNGTCPNIFRVLSDRFHEDVLGLNQEHGEDSDDGEDSDQDADDSDEETQDSDENGDGPGSKSGTVVEGTSEYELRPEDTNDDIGFVVAEEGDVLLTEKEDRYLSGGDNHAWFFAVGDAKGGCFVLRLDMYPGTAEYDERVRRFQTERVKELYERTKRARRMKIHVDYVIGQLIDTSPLDRGDQEKHDKFRASLKIQVTDTFKLIPGAISSMEYDDGKMVLAGLDRRLYIHKKTGATWFRTHKINLKGKLTSVVTSV